MPQEDAQPLTPVLMMSVACENLSTDVRGKVTLHNLIDSLTAPSFPAATAQLYMVFAFYSPAGSGHFLRPTVTVSPHNGEPIFSQQLPQDVTFSPSSPQARIVVGLSGMVWPQPGEYIVKLTSGKSTKASFPLRVTYLDGTIPETTG